MDLVDALASNTSATSLVELSLNPAFRREYPSIFDGIENFFKPKSTAQPQEADAKADSPPSVKTQRLKQEKAMTRLIATTIPPLNKRRYHTVALDATPNPRPFAQTLKDRVFTHSPNPIKGNRPVTIGHPYSVLAYIPEKEHPSDPKWVAPLSIRRVDSESLETVVGAQQIKSLMKDTQLPFHKELVVKVSDSKYSARRHVSQTAVLDNLIDIVRSAGNRAMYQSPPARPEGQKKPANHPTWFGEKFSMKKPDTWHSPTETAQMTTVTKKRKKLTFHIQCWNDMLVRGKDGISMHEHPFRLLRVTCVDDNDNPVYKRPIRLQIFGKRRNELTLTECVEAYLQRYDIEHFFRFGKQKLLLTAAQTPIVENEENWWQITMLAYTQLWMSRQLVRQTPRPWERYQQLKSVAVATPSATQRDFGRLIQQFGAPAESPKPRGYSSGRQKGDKQAPRTRHPIIKKSEKPTPSTKVVPD